MKKMMMGISFVLIFVVLGCGGNEEVAYYSERQNGEVYSDDFDVIVEYETNDSGVLTSINIDRLLTLEEIFYLFPLIDVTDNYMGVYDTFSVYTQVLDTCTDYPELVVPKNVIIDNNRFMYEEETCMYKEVDRYNDIREGSIYEEYALDDYILEEVDADFYVVVYDADSIDKFNVYLDLPFTYKQMGIYTAAVMSSGNIYSSDMNLYEELLLRYQVNDDVTRLIMGYPFEVSLFDLDDANDVEELIEDFMVVYESEINAIENMEEIIMLHVEEETEE